MICRGKCLIYCEVIGDGFRLVGRNKSICRRERYLWHKPFRQTCIRPVHLCRIAAPPRHVPLTRFPLTRSQLLRVPLPRFPLLRRPCLRLDAICIPSCRTGLHDSSAVGLEPKWLRNVDGPPVQNALGQTQSLHQSAFVLSEYMVFAHLDRIVSVNFVSGRLSSNS